MAAPVNMPASHNQPEGRPVTSSVAREIGTATPIAVVAGCLFRYDAISSAAFDTFDALAADPAYDVTMLTSHNEVAERTVQIAHDAGALLLHPRFRAAKLIIHHFGIYHPLFDVMPVGNGRALRAAFFHNITPAEFAPPEAAPTIAKSYRQLQNLRYMDEIWPVSQTNVETLADLDFKTPRIEVIPLAVSAPEIAPLSAKGGERVEVLFLGRVVKAKGIVDLIEALAALPMASMPPYRLRIAGNLSHSDGSCVETVRSMVAANGLDSHVDFLGTVDDAARDKLLATSHILAIPSYHEGFCKPVIEGLRAGCVPVGYAAYNLRYIADGLARMVPPGDVGALSRALGALVCEVYAARNDPSRALTLDRGAHTLEAFDLATVRHVAQFDSAKIASLTRDRVRTLLGQPLERKSPFIWPPDGNYSGGRRQALSRSDERCSAPTG